MRISGAEARCRPARDELELFDLSAAVQPVTALVPVRDHEPVPLFPGPDRRDWEADHAADGADAVERAASGPVFANRAAQPTTTDGCGSPALAGAPSWPSRA